MEVNDSEENPLERINKFRDKFFFLVFLVSIGGMIYIGFLSVKYGQPRRYILGTDSWGNTCGEKNDEIYFENVTLSGLDRREYKKQFFFAFLEPENFLSFHSFLSSYRKFIRLCIKECPNRTISCNNLLIENEYSGISEKVIRNVICKSSDGPIKPHKSLLNKCIPKFATVENTTAVLSNETSLKKVYKKAITTQENIMKYFNENIANNFNVFGFSIGFSILISTVFIIILRICSRVVIYTIVIVSVTVCIFVCAFCWYQYALSTSAIDNEYVANVANKVRPSKVTSEVQSFLNDNGQENMSAPKTHFVMLQNNLATIRSSSYFFYVCIGVSVISSIVTILAVWSRKSVIMAVKLFTEASTAISSMPCLLFQPVITIAFSIAVLAASTVVLIYMFSIDIGRVDENELVEYILDPRFSIGVLFGIFVFCSIWLIEFIRACQLVTIADAIGTWYFFRTNLSSVTSFICPSLAPTFRLIRYNMGSIAFGSLLTSILVFARWIVVIIQYYLQKLKKKKCACLMKMLECCMLFFEKILRYVSRNAYISVALFGDSYLSGAKHSLSLIVNNARYTLTISMISRLLLFFTKISIIVATILSTFYYHKLLVLESHTDLDALIPLIFAALVSWFVSRSFLDVYSMSIDTLLICFCEDMRTNDGETRPYHTTVQMQALMMEEKTKFESSTKIGKNVIPEESD